MHAKHFVKNFEIHTNFFIQILKREKHLQFQKQINQFKVNCVNIS